MLFNVKSAKAKSRGPQKAPARAYCGIVFPQGAAKTAPALAQTRAYEFLVKEGVVKPSVTVNIDVVRTQDYEPVPSLQAMGAAIIAVALAWSKAKGTPITEEDAELAGIGEELATIALEAATQLPFASVEEG